MVDRSVTVVLASLLLPITFVHGCGGNDPAGPDQDTGQVDSGMVDTGGDDTGSPDGGEADAVAGCHPADQPVPVTAPDATLADPVTFAHPEPGGPHAVGTHIVHLVDDSRLETVTEDPDDVRQLMVQLFYPTAVTAGPPAPIIEAEVAAVLAEEGYPAGLHERYQSASTFDVPVAQQPGGWPVLIYSHGQGGFRWDNFMLLEELASRGYFVVAVSHTYFSGAVVFPDGEVTRADGVPERIQDPTIEQIRNRRENATSVLTGIWVADLQFVLDSVAEWNRDAPCSWLSGQLDLTRIGILGYSYGGAAAHQTCLLDARCDAAVNLDGSFFGDLTSENDDPFMFLSGRRGSSAWDTANASLTGDGYAVRIGGMTHANFGISGIYISALYPGLDLQPFGFGPIDPMRGFQIYRDYVVAFLSAQLQGGEEQLLEGPSSSYPEVLFERTVAGLSEGPLIAFGEATVGLATMEAAEDITVRLLEDDEATTVDDWGLWQIDALPTDPSFTVAFTAEEIFSTIVTAHHSGRYVHPNVGPLLELAEAERLATEAGQVLDPTRGHIVVWSIFRCLHRNMTLMNGLSVSTDSGQGPFFLDDTYAVDPELTGTSMGVGVAILFNVDAGAQTLTFTHDSLSCWPEGLSDTNGTVDVIVRPGHVTYQTVYCE